MKKRLEILLIIVSFLTFSQMTIAQNNSDTLCITIKDTKQNGINLKDSILCVSIGGVMHGSSNNPKTISKETILKFPELKCSLNGFKVTSFQFSCLINGNSIEIQETGGKFDDAILQAVNDISSGKNIYFENIQYKSEDGKFVGSYGSFYYVIE